MSETQLDPEKMELNVISDGGNPPPEDQQPPQAALQEGGIMRAQSATIRLIKGSTINYQKCLIKFEQDALPSADGSMFMPNPLRRFLAIFPQREDGQVVVEYYNLDAVAQLTFRGE